MLQATAREAVFVVCDDCGQGLVIRRTESDSEIRARVEGWAIDQGTGRVRCTLCYLMWTDGTYVPIPTLLVPVVSGAIHRYDPDSGGPPGDCRYCARPIGPEEPYLTHSANYPRLPVALQRFPVHKECWQRVASRYLIGGHRYAETYRVGW